MDETLHDRLFADDGTNSYAVIDGASCEELLDNLDEHSPAHYCLYTGELAADVQQVAPYLVELRPDHPFTAWYLGHCTGAHWGIFARSAADLRALRKHFRKFLLVKLPGDKTAYFRFYDPRVLGVFLPTCDRGQAREFFGPVENYLCEQGDRALLSLSQTDGVVETRTLPNPGGASAGRPRTV